MSRVMYFNFVFGTGGPNWNKGVYYHSVKFSSLGVRCILRIPPSFSVKMSYL